MLGEQVPVLGCDSRFLHKCDLLLATWQPGNLATCWQPAGNRRCQLLPAVASHRAPGLATFAGNSWQQLATAGNSWQPGNLATWQPGNLLATCWQPAGYFCWQPGNPGLKRARGPPSAGCTSPIRALPNGSSLTWSQQPHTEHLQRSRSRLGCAPHRTRRADRVRSRGRALQLANGPPRELDAHSSGIGRRDRSSGGSRAQTSRERAASEPSRGQPTHGRVRELHRSTRLKRLTDLEGRAPAGGNRSS